MVEKHGYGFSEAAMGEMRSFDALIICGTGASPDVLCHSIHPDLLVSILQLRAEQRRIVEKHGYGYSRAAMGEMRYADALAREVLRIWGPVDILFRFAPTPGFLHRSPSYCKIRAGQSISVSLHIFSKLLLDASWPVYFSCCRPGSCNIYVRFVQA